MVIIITHAFIMGKASGLFASQLERAKGRRGEWKQGRKTEDVNGTEKREAGLKKWKAQKKRASLRHRQRGSEAKWDEHALKNMPWILFYDKCIEWNDHVTRSISKKKRIFYSFHLPYQPDTHHHHRTDYLHGFWLYYWTEWRKRLKKIWREEEREEWMRKRNLRPSYISYHIIATTYYEWDVVNKKSKASGCRKAENVCHGWMDGEWEWRYGRYDDNKHGWWRWRWCWWWWWQNKI